MIKNAIFKIISVYEKIFQKPIVIKQIDEHFIEEIRRIQEWRDER